MAEDPRRHDPDLTEEELGQLAASSFEPRPEYLAWVRAEVLAWEAEQQRRSA